MPKIRKGDVVTDSNGVISLVIETNSRDIDLLCIHNDSVRHRFNKLQVCSYMNTENWVNDHINDEHYGDAKIHGNIGDLLMIFKEALDEANGIPEER